MAVNTDIFLGSGASLTFVPEQDIYVRPASLNGAKDTVTPHSDFTSSFHLVPDLYVGCEASVLKTSRADVRIKSNTATTLVFSEDVSSFSDGEVNQSRRLLLISPKATKDINRAGNKEKIVNVIISLLFIRVPSFFD